jgi:CIC family chloride channel protein
VKPLERPSLFTLSTLLFWLWAALAGIVSAAATMGFRLLIDLLELGLTTQPRGLVAAATALPPAMRILIGTAGGGLAGALLWLGTRWAGKGPHGDKHIDYIDAARLGKPYLNNRTTLTRSAASLFSVASGASVGREGPMVQLAAWASVILGRLLKLPREDRNALMVCGIASGIGAAYHAPVAGVVFVLELALGFLARHTVAPVLIAVAASSIVIHGLGLAEPIYITPASGLAPGHLGFAALTGVLCGSLGTGLLYGVEYSRKVFARISPIPLRLMLGGLLTGGLSALVPEVWGNGFSTVSRVLHGGAVVQWVALVFAIKLLATLFSTGSGAIGGLFTPTLFIGATGGFLLGDLGLHALPPDLAGAPVAAAVIGMAAALAAATQAPLMAIIMVLEMTGQFQLTVPIMLAVGVAYAVSTRFGTRPLYGNPIEGQHRLQGSP